MAEVQLVIVEGPHQGREFDLTGSVVAGRDPEAGLVVDDAEASRRHAALSAEGPSVTVADLGSTNGTFVNGERLSGPRTVVDGDRIRIGTTVLEVRSLAQPTRLGTAIPEEPDLQATRLGTAVPDAPEEPAAPPAPEAPPPAEAPGAPPPEPRAPEPVGGPGGAPPPSGPPGGGPGGPPPGGPPPGAPPGGPPPGGPPGGPPPAFPPPGGPPPGAPPPPGGAGGPAAPPPAAFPPPPAPPAGIAAPGRPPAPYGAAAPAFAGYPVEYEADYPSQGIARWRCFFQGFLAIPHFFALFFVLIAAYIAVGIAWWVILFTRRYPRGIFNFVAGTLRWAQRVNGYQNLMTEAYPPFGLADDPSYPIRVRIAYPERGIARWRPLVQGFLAIPHFIALWFVGIGAAIAIMIAWFAILFTRTFPPGLFNFVAGTQRWGTRVAAYSLLMTEEYPPFGLA